MDRLVLVGASGTIGAATLMAAKDMNLNVAATYQSREIPGGIRFNIQQDSPALLNIKPGDVIVIFAAFSDQEWIRTHPREAHELNVTATARLAFDAFERNARVIFLSSEAVFGKSKSTGWTESDAPCPTTEYGRQKYEMEKILLSSGQACVVRTGWNVSYRLSDRCVVRSTYESLLDGSARLADDNTFSLTDVNDTARLIIQTAAARKTGIVHAVSGVPITRTSLADEIVRSSAYGHEMKYERIHFSDLKFNEPKPASAWLRLAQDSEALGSVSFSRPTDVIRKKVALLDAARSDGTSRQSNSQKQ